VGSTIGYDRRVGGRTPRVRVVAGLIGLAVLGVAVIALPDTGPRLVTFSETHGPSALDAVGVVLLLAAWAPVPVVLLRRRRRIRPAVWAAAAVVAVLAAAALVVAISRDLAWWWLPGIALVLVQAVLLRSALEEPGPTG
jgi:O-antigen/teichoic acid export membrane protein